MNLAALRWNFLVLSICFGLEWEKGERQTERQREAETERQRHREREGTFSYQNAAVRAMMTKDWVHGVGHSTVCQILFQIVVRAVTTSSPPA